MMLFTYIRQQRWTTLLGYLLFIGMMAAGYHYNITFIQIGMTDLGENILSLSKSQVAAQMGWLALVACLTALLVGLWMQRSGWSANFWTKIRMAFMVVLVQALLTAAAPWVKTGDAFLAWILAAGVALGVGMPATFSLTVDLIPRRDRGYAAALVTAGAYFFAEVFSGEWSFSAFRSQALLVLIPGALAMGLLASRKLRFLETLAHQHRQPDFYWGRFVRPDERGRPRIQRSLIGLLALMFGVFFVDSLGFLRLLDTPLYMQTAWQSSELDIRLVIAITHVVAALVGGVLYTNTSGRSLFLWIFGIFALTHLQYTFHVRVSTGESAPLAMPVLYALAVSLYTVLNFAVWADLSTPQNISLHSALGVAFSGWTATFLSTALSIQWATHMPLEQHLRLVDALAFLFFLGTAILLYFQKPAPPQRAPRSKQAAVERRPE